MSSHLLYISYSQPLCIIIFFNIPTRCIYHIPSVCIYNILLYSHLLYISYSHLSITIAANFQSDSVSFSSSFSFNLPVKKRISWSGSGSSPCNCLSPLTSFNIKDTWLWWLGSLIYYLRLYFNCNCMRTSTIRKLEERRKTCGLIMKNTPWECF